MYNNHFGLRDTPFSIAPNPHFLYLSSQHREALAHLLFGIQHDSGIILLTGEVGTGKTTVCRCFLEQLPDDVEAALILNPKLSSNEILNAICDELKLKCSPGQSEKHYIDALNQHLLENHQNNKRTLLIIDEAQNLSDDVLEQLRLLTNLETHTQKLLQIVLVGQPELREKLQQRQLRQLAQRVTARYHIESLQNTSDSVAYVNHRLQVAGTSRALFSAAAIKLIHKRCNGIPRIINTVCDRALLGCYAEGKHKVNKAIAGKACHEVLGGQAKSSSLIKWLATLSITLLAGGSIYAWLGLTGNNPKANNSTLTQAPAPVIADKGLPSTEAKDMAASTANLDAFFADSTSLTNNAALAHLQTLWGLPPLGGEDPCSWAQESDLWCLNSRGTIRLLRILNRPAVLTLYDGQGVPHYAVLSIQAEQLRLNWAQNSLAVSLESINRYWSGEFNLLWQTPEGYTAPLRPATYSATVPALRSLFFQQTDLEAEFYDASLENHIQLFQKTNGLAADGVVGPMTWITLNSYFYEDVPKLKTTELTP